VSVAATLADAPNGDLPVVGSRIRALREAMDLSLRDLADRSGVSAPMLSQVERGATSPTLAVATRIAAGLDLSLSQLLRLDEDGHVVVVRRGQGRKRRHGGHRVEELTPPLPGQRADVSLHQLGPGVPSFLRERWRSLSMASVTSCEPETASPSTPTFRTTSKTTGSNRPSSWPSWRRAFAGDDDAENHVRENLGRPRGR
jgi:transcriptional regulator with XRE-family HTH domain